MMKMIYRLRFLTEVIALILCVILIVAGGFLTYRAFGNLLYASPEKAVVDALFVIIVLELFYVIRSFIKRGSINVGLIINVGVIAAVKEMVFVLDSITWQLAVSFAVIFLSLGILYLLEIYHYEKKHEDGFNFLKEETKE